MPEGRRGECWWLVLPDGTPLAGDDGGGLRLLQELPVLRPVGRLFAWLRLSPLLDRGDHLLARHRKRLGRLVPDGPAPRRYP